MMSLPACQDVIASTPAWTNKNLYREACQLQAHEQWAKASNLFYYLSILYPDLHQAKFNLGICQMQLKYWQGAEYSFLSLADPQHPSPDLLCNLAVVYWQSHQIKSALRLFKFIRKNFPHHVDTLENLAAFYLQFKRLPRAIQIYQDILRFNHKHTEVRFNLATCLQQLGVYDEAIIHYQKILHVHPQYYDALYNLGCLYYTLKDWKAAKFYWYRGLELKPQQKSLRFMYQQVASGEFDLVNHRFYVQDLFNHYAASYDQHMQCTLDYQLPPFLKKYLATNCQLKQFIKTLDIGCGTGLCGEVLSLYSEQLIGIDLSENMIELAKKTGHYQKLYTDDGIHFLEHTQEGFDLVVAMDVTPYIYDLRQWLESIQAHLNPKADLIFSIEVSTSECAKLEATGRISHSPHLIHLFCQQLQLRVIDEKDVFTRLQNQIPILERVYHLKKA